LQIIQLLGSTLGLGLVSGINLYATVLVVGLGIRLGLIVPYPGLEQLHVLANPIVIAVAGVIFVVEFLADKIKWIDSIWDAVHTFIRPLGAAAIGATAIGQTGPEAVVIALLCGGVALSGHSTKAGIRLLVNHSPEPYSNVAVSLLEDGAVVIGTYLAMQYPYVMLFVVAVFMIAFLWFAPKAFRLIRVEIAAITAVIKKLFASFKRFVLRKKRQDFDEFANDQMPADYHYFIKDKFNLDADHQIVKCVAGKGIRGLRHSIGYLNVTSDQLIFVGKRLLRFRTYTLLRSKIDDVLFKKHPLMDRLSLRVDGKQHVFYFFKEASNRGETVCRVLRKPTLDSQPSRKVTTIAGPALF
jgi:Domain of unknown function (DUF4126)